MGSGNCTAMILAAGLGTRLRPLTQALPKPCVPFLNAPLLYRSLDQLQRAGHGKVVVNGAYRREVLAATLAALSSHDAELFLSEEEECLGTAGGVVNASRFFETSSSILLLNGDVLTELDLEAFMHAHDGEGAYASLALFESPELPAALHKVGYDAEGNVTSVDGVLATGPVGPEVGRGIYTGVLGMSPEFLKDLPEESPACLKEDGFWPALREGKLLKARFGVRHWADIGTPEAYLEAHFHSLLRSGEEMCSHGYVSRGSGVWIHEHAQVHRDVQMEGPVLVGAHTVIHEGVVLSDGVCLGSEVQVPAGTRLAHSVVWDRQSVPATGLVDSIQFHGGTVQVAR